MAKIQNTDEKEIFQFTCNEEKSTVTISNAPGVDPKDLAKGLQKVTGAKDTIVSRFLLSQGTDSFGITALDQERSVSTCVALLRDIEPQNATQGLLATQMIAIHNLAMEMLRRAGFNNQTFAGVDANINRANKLLKTFATQTEAMQKLQGKSGKQKMTVEHVHVNEGGQAIIGTVENGGRGKVEKG